MTEHSPCTWHWADPATAARLPEPVMDPALLARTRIGLQIPLPECAPGDLVVPSFASLRPGRFRFRLGPARLGAVPSRVVERHPLSRRYRSVEAQLDAWMLGATPTAPALTLEVSADALQAPHWLSVSVRPARLEPGPPDSKPETTTLPAPPKISQMTWPGPAGPRICSPTAATMALQASGYPALWASMVNGCRDPATGLYGVWPLNIYRASQLGALGSVICFRSWQEVQPWLAAGCYVVASIRYGAGELPGAPQASTSGHLVLLYGVDGQEVLVNDPAAPNTETVARRYPLAAFSRAWFRARGAGYVFLPADGPAHSAPASAT